MNHRITEAFAKSLFKIFELRMTIGMTIRQHLKSRKLIQQRFCSSAEWNSISDRGFDKYVAKLLIDELNVDKPIALYLLHKTKYSNNVTESVLRHNIEVIKERNWPLSEVIRNPKVLVQKEGYLNQRLDCLQEFGFRLDALTIRNVFSYSQLIKRPVEQLKKRRLLVNDNLYDHMLHYLDCPVTVKNSIRLLFMNDAFNVYSILTIRKSILLQYLSWRLKMSISDILVMVEKYSCLGNRSLQQLKACIDCLLLDFGISPTKVRTNGFLLISNISNLKKILHTVPTIGGLPLKEVVSKYPRVLSMSAKGLLEVNNILAEHNITKEQIENCLSIFTLRPRTVKERLNKLKDVVEFEVMLSYPRLLCLVYYQQKAIERLEFLKSIGYECISLDLLVSSTSHFKSTILTDDSVQIIRFRGKEIIQYLSKLFNKSQDVVREQIVMHPMHSKKSSFNCKNVISFLISEGFPLDVIFNSLYIILYDVNDIKSALTALPLSEDTVDFRDSWKTSPYSLQFVVYMLEKEVRFSGNAVWSEDTSHWSSENIVDHQLSDKPLCSEGKRLQKHEKPETLTVKKFLGIEPAT